MRGEEGEAREASDSYMSRKMRPEKRVRVEEDGVEDRVGVNIRNHKYVVEMRLPKKVGNVKLHFGSYESVNEANVARDYGAYLRDSTGKEDPATVGGFNNPPDHPRIFKYEGSPAVFESLKGSGSGSRAQDEFKRLLELQTPDACKEFSKAAREDIRVAIDLFRRDPQRFLPPLLNCLSNAVPVHDGEIHGTLAPSSSEVGVSPTPGREVGISMGEGSTSFVGALSREVQITVNVSHFQTLLLMNVPCHTVEEIFMAIKAGIDRVVRELIDKWLEEVEPCHIDPETIPVLE